MLRDSRVTTPRPVLLHTRDPEHQHKSLRQHFTWALPEGCVGWRELNYVLPISRRRVRERDKKGCYHHPGNYPGGNYLFLEHACNKLWTTITTWEVSRGVMFAALLVTLLSVTTALLCYLTHNNLYVRSEVLTAVSITVRLFSDIALCTLLNRCRHFEAVSCLRRQGKAVQKYCFPGALSLGGKTSRAWRQSLASNTEIRKKWSCTSTPPYTLKVCARRFFSTSLYS